MSGQKKRKSLDLGRTNEKNPRKQANKQARTFSELKMAVCWRQNQLR